MQRTMIRLRLLPGAGDLAAVLYVSLVAQQSARIPRRSFIMRRAKTLSISTLT